MADLIKIKSGAIAERETMPALAEDELGYRKDEKALYLGTENGNERLCGVNDAVKIGELVERVTATEAQLASITARLEALENPSE